MGGKGRQLPCEWGPGNKRQRGDGELDAHFLSLFVHQSLQPIARRNRNTHTRTRALIETHTYIHTHQFNFDFDSKTIKVY